jgi:magnesium chelatase family protein
LKAVNPCNCGYLGHHNGRCRCTADQVARYRSRISGPLLDRIDLRVEMSALSEADLFSAKSGESSAAVRMRVTRARQAQLDRQGSPNAQLAPSALQEHAQIDSDGKRLLRDAIRTLNLTARAHHRIIRIARTIADLEAWANIHPQHIAEALHYRGS